MRSAPKRTIGEAHRQKRVTGKGGKKTPSQKPRWVKGLFKDIIVAIVVAFILSIILPRMPWVLSGVEQRDFPVHLSANTSFYFPIDLRHARSLQFNWWVESGGEVAVGFATPNGEYFGFCDISGTLKEDCNIPLKESKAFLQFGEKGWARGLYNVQMKAYSDVTELHVQYWIKK